MVSDNDRKRAAPKQVNVPDGLVTSVVDLVGTGPVELGAYTEAELTAVDAIVDFLYTRPSDEVLAEAVRSLAARGLLVAADGAEQVEVRGDLGIAAAFQQRARMVLDARSTGTGPGEPWRILLLPQPEPITMLVRIDALGIHEISLRKRDEALKLLAEWLPRGRAADDDTGLEAEAVLKAAERSALVTVTRYTIHGSAELAGASTDLVLAQRDGRLHAFTRAANDGHQLRPGGLNGKSTEEALAGFLVQADLVFQCASQNLHLQCRKEAIIYSVGVGLGDVMDQDDRLARIGEVALELGLSASRIRQLADTGMIPSTRSSGGQRLFDLGEVRAAIARRSLPLDPLAAAEEARPSWDRELTLLGLQEGVVWERIKEDLNLPDTESRRIMAFAFTEMLNNAIDHSSSDTATIKWWVDADQWSFEIRDYGVGAFSKLQAGLNLANDFEAVQELSKGKRTTDRVHHTGQGIFFTSKAVDVFRLTSAGIRWTVDNIREDSALGVAPLVKGTSVECQVDPQTLRSLPEVFGQFTNDDAAFIRTRPVVKLFEIGTTFVSRSEAKRLLEGLAADFDAVDVDFSGVSDVGQGFVDELLRVWPNAHPGKTVNPINMNPAVEFMVRRGLTQ